MSESENSATCRQLVQTGHISHIQLVNIQTTLLTEETKTSVIIEQRLSQ